MVSEKETDFVIDFGNNPLDGGVSKIDTIPMTNLHDYLTAQGLTPEKFAKQINIKNKSTIYKWINGDNVPRPESMDRIIGATGGEVDPASFYEKRRTRTDAAPPVTVQD